MLDLSASPRLRSLPEDCQTRLLLDPWLCVGPGSEAHAATLFEISQAAASLGITLCVEAEAWTEAARDPDVVRRRVDLDRLEPILKLPPLPLPSERDATARFMPVRSEVDMADLKLLGALHARVAHHLVALDGRMHRLAARAGLASRVLTPADAASWLAALGGRTQPVTLLEIDPRLALAPGRLSSLIAQECEPHDPYLRGRLEAAHGRVLTTSDGDTLRAVGVLGSALDDEHLELLALAAHDGARGARVLEPIVGTALSMARRRGMALEALLPPHEEMVLLLLEQLGFERLGADAHGRERLRHEAAAACPQLAGGQSAWFLRVDADTHDRFLPELAGAAQTQLFAVGAGERPPTLGSSVRKQVMLPAGGRAPQVGDLLLVFHARTPGRAASATITAVARVERLTECSSVEEVLTVNACRPGYSLREIRERLAQGPVTVLDAALLGRLDHLLPLAWLKEQGVVTSAPRGLVGVEADAWTRLAPRLALA